MYFGVTSGKLLGFLITQREIEVYPTKIRAIVEMQPPKNEKELRGFLGRVQFINYFISKITMTCDPHLRLLSVTSWISKKREKPSFLFGIHRGCEG